MPTSYDGDKNATQFPSPAPEGEGLIRVSLPADGDAPNAAAFEQAFKVSADFIAWLLNPQAKASAWEKVMRAYRAAVGHRRFAVDHLGFPTGQVLVHDVVWRSALGLTEKLGADAGSRYTAMPDWTYHAVATTGAPRAIVARSVYGPSLGILPGDTLNDYSTVVQRSLGQLRSDNHVVLEFTASTPAQNSLTSHIALCDEPSTHVNAASDFIGFRNVGNLYWLCVTKAGGVETVTNTFLAAAITGFRPDRLRIEWSGETVADDATRSVRFYVNGALVATHITNLPLDMGAGIAISEQRTTAAAGGDTLLVGAMRFRMSLSDSDTVL